RGSVPRFRGARSGAGRVSYGDTAPADRTGGVHEAGPVPGRGAAAARGRRDVPDARTARAGIRRRAKRPRRGGDDGRALRGRPRLVPVGPRDASVTRRRAPVAGAAGRDGGPRSGGGVEFVPGGAADRTRDTRQR